MKKLIYIASLFFTLTAFTLPAQEPIPMGAWRAHLSYNAIHSVAVGDGRVYGASTGGVMVLDQADKSLSTYNKLNGLSGSDISATGYAAGTDHLIIAYADGNLDLVRNNVVTNFDRLKTSVTITGSKKINHVMVRQNLAYLSADYGMVVFDLQQGEVKETWRDLEEDGLNLAINQAVFKGDSVFLATDRGVLVGNVNDNLLDYNNWKRFQTGDLDTPVQSITFFNDHIYISITQSGLYRYEDGEWIKETFLQDVPIQTISSSSTNLLIAQDVKVWSLNESNELSEIVSGLITYPHTVLGDEAGNVWIGDMNNGLVSYSSANFANYLPNGPAVQEAFKLNYANNEMVALGRAHTGSFLPSGKPGAVSVFSSQWSSHVSPMSDITGVVFHNGQLYASSFGYGVQVGNLAQPETIFNEDNSTLINLNPSFNEVYVTALESSPQGLWVTNYGTNVPLHLLANDSWQSFSFIQSPASYPTALMMDWYGSVWMLLNPSQGGGILVYNKEQNASVYLTDQVGNGGMPSRAVRSIAFDKDGYVWVGTDKGVAYFPNPLAVFDSQVDAIEPIFESRFLLSDERVTAIAIDGGNRKWIGTERGVWLFNPTTEEIIYHFTEENSPLLSDVIHDIEINPVTGEVFFATSKGVVSFRSDATESTPVYSSVKIFPNPVTSDFTGTVGISGLATDAIVKITDASGKLIWQTQANGGTATWNGRDYNGKKAATGIYLVFSASPDGVESYAGKIAVVE